MKQFINLSSIIINKLHISRIIKKPNKYEIYMNTNIIDGFWLVASGRLTSYHHILEISEIENKQDYEKITELIKQI